MKHIRAGFVLVTIVLAFLILQGVSPVYAWNFSVNAEPEVRYAFPGQTVSYTVYVGLVTGPAATVQLLVSPMTIELQGLNFWFSPSASGTPPFTRTMYVAVSSGKAPGTYTIPVAGFNPGVGWRIDNVQLVVLSSVAITDWAFSNPTMDPSSPKIGDSTRFSAVLRALSTNSPYPQSVRIAAILDGTLLGSSVLSYPGPTGALMTVTTGTPWIATEGHHTVLWVADPSPYSYNDPYRYNNEASLSFTVSAAPPPFDFSISASPPTRKVTAGEVESYTIVVSLVSGEAKPVSLTLAGLPSEVKHSFNPPSSNPTFQSTLEVVTGKNAKPGTYTLTLTASGGGLSRTASLTLEIEAAPEEDFVITVTPTSSQVEQGEVATHVVTVNALAGFKSAVDLSVSGLPEGTTASFSQSRVSPGGTSTLTIKTSRKTPTGSYAITVAGSGGGKTHDATIALNIKEGKPLSILEMLAEYSLLLVALIAALAIILVLVIVFVVLRRRPPSPPLAPSPAPQPMGAFCASCGSKIPGDAQFCPKCGAKKVTT